MHFFYIPSKFFTPFFHPILPSIHFPNFLSISLTIPLQTNHCPKKQTRTPTGDNIRERILWNHNIVNEDSMLGDFMGHPCPPVYVLMKNDMYVILCGVCFLCHCDILFVGLSCWKTTQYWTDSLCRL